MQIRSMHVLWSPMRSSNIAVSRHGSGEMRVRLSRFEPAVGVARWIGPSSLFDDNTSQIRIFPGSALLPQLVDLQVALPTA